MTKLMLVYQAGLANLFEVEAFNLSPFGREAKRILQADFRTCEMFARGAGYAGAVVRSAACNQAGDITDAKWTDELESQPFSNEFSPVTAN